MILDAGVFMALERPSQRGVVSTLMRRLSAVDQMAATNEAVVAQVWRDPARQHGLGRLLGVVDVFPFGDAKTIGMRCARTGTSDVVDASLAVLADQLNQPVITTDPDDFARLGVAVVDLRHVT